MNSTDFIVHRFPLRWQEEDFLHEYARRFSWQRRFAFIGSAIIWSVYFIRDWWLLGGLSSALLFNVFLIRVIESTIIVLIIWSGCRPIFNIERWAVRIISIGVISAWVSVLAIVALIPIDISLSDYSPGFSMIFFVHFTMLRLRVKIASIIGGICLALFHTAQLCQYLFTAADADRFSRGWVSVGIALTIFYVMGIGVSCQLEIAARRDFVGRLSLRIAKDRANAVSNKLKLKNMVMRELVSEKERFFSAAYHDIQQPLAAINLFIRSAKIKLFQGVNAEKDLAVVENMARDILDMFKDIQDYSELGEYDEKLTTVDINQILIELADQFFCLAKSANIALVITACGQEPLYVLTDRALLKRAISNLISNAIKYTNKGGVVIGYIRLKDRIRVDVRDTGVGIDLENQTKIFSEYFQINNPGRDRAKGLGLGLSIVSRIVRILTNHRLTVFSRPNMGSRFSIYVPYSITPLQYPPRGGNIPSTDQDLSNCFIILCDDEPDILEGLRRLFAEAGALVEVASSIEEVEVIISRVERAPDVIVTDIRLRGGPSGVDVASMIRAAYPWAASIPVAFVTGELFSIHTLGDVPSPFIVLRKSSAPHEILSGVCCLLRESRTKSRILP